MEGPSLETIRIFVASADENLRLALLIFLDHQPGMVVVGLSDRLAGLHAQVTGAQPGVLILDWELLADMHTQFLTNLHNLENPPKVIILTSQSYLKQDILAKGADFCICKDAPPDNLLSVLHQIQSEKRQ